MVACLSCTPDVFSRYPILSSNPRFNSREALDILQKCSDFKQLKQIHVHIIRNGLTHNQILVTKLIRLYSSFRRMDYATVVFRQIQNPHTFTWNLMIRSHSINGASREALLLYNLMIIRGVPPDKFTFPFVIKACLLSSAIDKGKEAHALAIKTGFSGDMFVQNTLMDFYFSCSDSVYGRQLFNKMRVRNVVSWTTMVSGLVSCGKLDAARAVFEDMPVRNVVSWTAMINGYARNRQPQEAFELFRLMQVNNVRPNEFTLVSLLVACTELGSLKLGSWIHDFALKNGFELEVFLGTALIDMCSKCGSLEEAKKVFDKMRERSLVTWNSMITSLGVHGRGEEALALFAEMEKANVRPDAITFVGVLCACVHTGAVNEGFSYFIYMREHYDIMPTVDHYSCMVELYRRAGMLDEAHKFLKSMPEKLDDEIFEALLGASGVLSNGNGEEVICERVEEVHCLSTLNGTPPAPNHCFEWEVG